MKILKKVIFTMVKKFLGAIAIAAGTGAILAVVTNKLKKQQKNKRH